jgi:hypothetical protein
VRSSLRNGYYQGWDLHPAQLVTRYAAVYSFFLEGLDTASLRLRSFVEKAAQATLVGDIFDDAATGQGLLNYFLRGTGCGAITLEEARATGLTLDELQSRSFLKILQGRRARRSDLRGGIVTDSLDFEKAEYGTPAHASCTECQQGLGTQYYECKRADDLRRLQGRPRERTRCRLPCRTVRARARLRFARSRPGTAICTACARSPATSSAAGDPGGSRRGRRRPRGLARARRLGLPGARDVPDLCLDRLRRTSPTS